jgi:hypothetical protein
LPLAVLPGNRRVWELWLALETQWRLVAGMTGLTRTGLDYPAADTVRRALGIKRRDWRGVLADLQQMEQWALAALNA